ncbi:pyridoxal 5'-phosphate synthase glutaminase subunit PdxT [Demetria terragena]|uniref:pyridoxal 5'-phosphate synthase glutaminase subunit PdxT n=1 Tax=Demetria terragena TaxID=63959 RepID=UPI00036F75BF|nr:pyridoxal 5'-phosphate synthase glutaminase subunit PdxT [Demetria terragena]
MGHSHSVESGQPVTIGVLAVQGDVREHLTALTAAGADAIPVRRPVELAAVDGIVLPGGESTTMIRLLRTFDLLEPLRAAIAAGLPAYGSCAGMILLADRLLDGQEGQATVGGIDMTVRRNAFGRQVDSFEGEVEVQGVEGGPTRGIFIRAPWVESAGPGVGVLAQVRVQAGELRAVAVRQGDLLATAFHPEVGSDYRVHGLFVDMVRERRAANHG